MTIPTANGLAEFADRYDLFLVDQFGVLHDGSAPYPGAIEGLARLKAAGRVVILISNSGRRAAGNEARLEQLGFDRASYDAFISSGEVAWKRIAEGAVPGRRCLLLNRRGDQSAVSGLPITLADTAEDADFVLITGSDGDVRPIDDYRDMLAQAADRDLPCLCANPDKLMVLSEGTAYGAGQIADLYEGLGGRVTWIGKPYPEIYRFAREEAARRGVAPQPDRIIGIGDSIEHDIAGAKRAGYAAALVLAGIHAGDDDSTLAATVHRHDAAPDLLLPRFTWAPEPS